MACFTLKNPRVERGQTALSHPRLIPCKAGIAAADGPTGAHALSAGKSWFVPSPAQLGPSKCPSPA